jgi:hypothetical protein
VGTNQLIPNDPRIGSLHHELGVVVGAVLDLTMHGRPRACSHHLIQQHLRRVTCNHGICDLISVALVSVPAAAETVGELDAGPLLDDMRSLVRCGVQSRWLSECNLFVAGVRLCAHPGSSNRRFTADVCSHPGNLVMTERSLDAIDMR